MLSAVIGFFLLLRVALIAVIAAFGWILHPDENRRLGFAYLVTDHEHGHQTWSVPGRFPSNVDPSTWSAVKLTDT